ncbi:hypothetical protein Tco_0961804, partial [Tanacetum coccineum]
IHQGRYGIYAPELHKKPRRYKDQYAVSMKTHTPYLLAVNERFWKIFIVVPTPRIPNTPEQVGLAGDLGLTNNVLIPLGKDLDSELQVYKEPLRNVVNCDRIAISSGYSQVKMDNPDITMEEYIQLEAEKALRFADGVLDLDATGLHTAEEMTTDGFRAYWADTSRVIASNADFRDY